MDCILAGDSCALVGAASTGKSNFFRFLLRPDVQQKYLDGQADHFLFLYIDGNSLIEMSEFAVYELLLHRTLQYIETLGEREDLLVHVDDLYERAVTSENRTLAQRYVERCVKILCEDLGLRLAILFDEFDELLERLDRRFFLNLRALRDDFKYKLCYIVATRKVPVRLREDIAEGTESFYELLTPHVRGLKPYSQADALEMIERMARRHDTTVHEEEARRLYELTGGHPGLIVGVFEVGCQVGWPPSVSQGIARYIEEPSVQEECYKLWRSLDADERQVLLEVCRGQAVRGSHDHTVHYLQVRGLVIEEERTNNLSAFSPLFTDYVQRYGPLTE